MPLILGLVAGILYAISAVLCKRGLELGAGTIRSLIFSNIVMSLCFLPYPILSSQGISTYDIQTGLSLGLLFFLGQFFCFWALKNGDASLITPIMGSKPIFVAIFLLSHGMTAGEVPWITWVASILAAFAIGLIGWPSRHHLISLRGLFLAIATAATFGLLDSLVPHFTHQSNPLNLLFILFGSVGLFSLFLVPYAEGKFFKYRKIADQWMWASAIFMGGQALVMSMAVGFYQVPTEVNIFYAGRGLWAVILIAWLGKKIGIEESSAPTQVLARRAVGAFLLIIGICLTAW